MTNEAEWLAVPTFAGSIRACLRDNDLTPMMLSTKVPCSPSTLYRFLQSGAAYRFKLARQLVERFPEEITFEGLAREERASSKIADGVTMMKRPARGVKKG